MATPLIQPATNQGIISFEMNQPHLLIDQQVFAVSRFQG